MSVERCGHETCGYQQRADYCLSDDEIMSERIHVGMALIDSIMQDETLEPDIEQAFPIPSGGVCQRKDYARIPPIEPGYRNYLQAYYRFERVYDAAAGTENASLMTSWKINDSNIVSRQYRLYVDSLGVVQAEIGCPALPDDYRPMTPYDFDCLERDTKAAIEQYIV